MLLVATESIGQAKWLLFRKQSRNLADFKTIDEASREVFVRIYVEKDEI